ncbi:hypothetical protein [Streptomyces cyaneofuscatus]|uniref:hypothetical protein n=1 Tax=Streptomyces cyaneofuscatus TaxID=66883 RepID=UPI0036254FEF
MPLTDSYGQGVTYPTLTDKPNAQTLGQGIVDGLTPKVVMTFASAVVRGATIKKPVAGMATWLRDVGQLQVYDGANWTTLTSGQSTWKTISLGQGFAQNGNQQGTFQYRVVNLFGEQMLYFRGGIIPTYITGDVQQNTLNSVALPANARPSTLRTILVPCSDVRSARIALRMDITTAGWLNLWGIQKDTNPPWVGFHGTFTSL